jgi:dTDP-4-dehydrorhamnose reductase
MTGSPIDPTAPALWGGVECTVARIGDRYVDQLELTGHAQRDDDLDRIGSLGIRTVRYPVLWERIEHRPGVFDWEWTDRRLARLEAGGIEVIAGLVHHGSGPMWTSLLDDSFATGLTRFAARVAQRYPGIRRFTVVNEPLTTARFSAPYGHRYPHARDDRSFARALLTQCRATAMAMEAIRRVRPDAELVQTEDVSMTVGSPAMADQAAFYTERAWLSLDLLCGAVDDAHPLRGYLDAAGVTDRELARFRDTPCAPALIGLNYYVTSDRYLDESVEDDAAWRLPSETDVRFGDIEAARAPCGIVGHLGHLARAWDRYRKPLAITEVHLDCAPDQQICWFGEAWRDASAARQSGIPVEAVTAWALFGAVDWDSLLTEALGHYEPGAFEVRPDGVHARPLAAVLARASRGRSLDRQGTKGWWRLPERLLVEPDLRERAS